MYNQICGYFQSLYRDIPMIVYEGMLLVFLLGVISILLYDKKDKGRRRKISGLLIIEYVFLLCCSMVIFRTHFDSIGHHFTPFWSYMAIIEGRYELLAENLMNVVVFIPLGSLLGIYIYRIKWWKIFIFGFCCSIGIESLQFYYQTGYAETDDVIHNTLGCMIGYGIYALARYGYERLIHIHG